MSLRKAESLEAISQKMYYSIKNHYMQDLGYGIWRVKPTLPTINFKSCPNFVRAGFPSPVFERVISERINRGITKTTEISDAHYR